MRECGDGTVCYGNVDREGGRGAVLLHNELIGNRGCLGIRRNFRFFRIYPAVELGCVENGIKVCRRKCRRVEEYFGGVGSARRKSEIFERARILGEFGAVVLDEGEDLLRSLADKEGVVEHGRVDTVREGVGGSDGAFVRECGDGTVCYGNVNREGGRGAVLLHNELIRYFVVRKVGRPFGFFQIHPAVELVERFFLFAEDVGLKVDNGCVYRRRQRAEREGGGSARLHYGNAVVEQFAFQ